MEVSQLWTRCSELLQEEVSEAVWNTWFTSLEPSSFDGETLVLTAASRVTRERLEERWMSLIEKNASTVAGNDVRVRISVRPAPAAADHYVARRPEDRLAGDRPPDGAGGDRLDPAERRADGRTEPGRFEGEWPNGSRVLPGGVRAEVGGDAGPVAARPEPPSLSPRYTFDAFVIGSSNRFAHAAAQRVAESPAASYNPLFIYGDSGLGKTHLLHAIGHYVMENFASKRVRYVSTETFMNDFVDAIRNNSQNVFKRRYRDCDVLLVDDIQFMENKESLQEEFFHTFNWLYEGAKQIVLSSDRHPRSIATLEDRLRSRFEWGLTTDVQPPELETRLAILRKKAEGERLHIPAEVLELIATHVRDNIRELEGALVRVSAWASLNNEPPTLDKAAEILSDVLEADRPRQITPKVILDATASAFNFTVEDLCGTNRRRPLVNARQIGMYLCRELTDYSYPAIAREFGGRDHTTVIHAVEKVSGLMKERRQVYDQVTELIVNIKGGKA